MTGAEPFVVTATDHWNGIVQALIVGVIIGGIAGYVEGLETGLRRMKAEIVSMREQMKRFVRMGL